MNSCFRVYLLITFFGGLVSLVYSLYYLYYFSPLRVLVGLAVLLSLVHVNKSIQGGK